MFSALWDFNQKKFKCGNWIMDVGLNCDKYSNLIVEASDDDMFSDHNWIKWCFVHTWKRELFSAISFMTTIYDLCKRMKFNPNGNKNFHQIKLIIKSLMSGKEDIKLKLESSFDWKFHINWKMPTLFYLSLSKFARSARFGSGVREKSENKRNVNVNELNDRDCVSLLKKKKWEVIQ